MVEKISILVGLYFCHDYFVGTGLLAGIVGIGLYGLKNRKMRLSLYLINLRLAAQGSFVSFLLLCSY